MKITYISFDGFPSVFEQAKTGIKFIDDSILNLYKSGYMHNHVRMYVASLICNFSNLTFIIHQNGCIIIY